MFIHVIKGYKNKFSLFLLYFLFFFNSRGGGGGGGGKTKTQQPSDNTVNMNLKLCVL